MTNDHVIDGGLTTGEPQACADLSLGGSIRSDITPTNDGGGLDDTSKRGWNESSIPKIHNPLTHPSECSLASVPPASASHDCDGLALQEEGGLRPSRG